MPLVPTSLPARPHDLIVAWERRFRMNSTLSALFVPLPLPRAGARGSRGGRRPLGLDDVSRTTVRRGLGVAVLLLAGLTGCGGGPNASTPSNLFHVAGT